MPRCPDHMAGRFPMFLHYESCDDCEESYVYRIREGGKRRAKHTRENRMTAAINGYKPSQAVRQLGFRCQLPKKDDWHEPHNLTPKKTRCRRCGARGKRKVAA